MILSNAVAEKMNHERVASDIPHSVLESGLEFIEEISSQIAATYSHVDFIEKGTLGAAK